MRNTPVYPTVATTVFFMFILLACMGVLACIVSDCVRNHSNAVLDVVAELKADNAALRLELKAQHDMLQEEHKLWWQGGDLD